MKLEGKRFVEPEEVETQLFDWGLVKWLSEPDVTNAKRFSFGVVFIQPGKGHMKHNHPGVEEIIYVISGEGEQMVAGNPVNCAVACGYIPFTSAIPPWF